MSEEIIRVDVSTNFTTPQLNSLSDFFFSFLTRMRNRKRKEKKPNLQKVFVTPNHPKKTKKMEVIENATKH
jgi:hypothetical protein